MLRDKGMMTNMKVSGLFMVDIWRGSAKPQSRSTRFHGDLKLLEVVFNGLDG